MIFRKGKRFFSIPQRPDGFWDPPRVLSNGSRKAGDYPGIKGAGAQSWPLTPIQFQGQERWSCNFTPSYVFMQWYLVDCRSRWPSGLNRALSSLARKPGPWGRIPLRAWMFSVCVCVCVFLCLCTGRGLAMSWSPVQGVLPISLIKKLRKLSPMLQKREQAPKCGSKEGGEGKVN
jgi:hypothetical protein